PFSWVVRRAISSACSSSSVLNLKRKPMRFWGGVRRQAGKAAAAAETAASTSEASARVTFARTSAVAGLKMSKVSEERPVRQSPPMQFRESVVCVIVAMNIKFKTESQDRPKGNARIDIIVFPHDRCRYCL